MALIHQNVKNTIIMFQCKIYLNTCLVLIHHASTCIGKSLYVQCFSLLWIGKEKNNIL